MGDNVTISISSVHSIIGGNPKPTVPKPGKNTPMDGLTVQAKKLWPKFWTTTSKTDDKKRQYGNIILQAPDDKQSRAGRKKVFKTEDERIQYMWATAFAIFTRWLNKRNIPMTTGAPNQESVNDMVNRLSANRDNVFSYVKSILRKLNTKAARKDMLGSDTYKVIQKILKERLEGVEFDGVRSGYLVKTYIKVKLNKDTNIKKLKQILKHAGGLSKDNQLKYSIDSHFIVIDIQEGKTSGSGTSLLIHPTLTYTEQHVRMILGWSQEQIKDKKKTANALARKYKALLKTNGAVDNKILAMVFGASSEDEDDTLYDTDYVNTMSDEDKKEYDFNTQLSKEDQESLTQLKKLFLTNDSSWVIENYSQLPTIQAIGTPLLQLNIVKLLLQTFGEQKGINIPPLWKAIVDNPSLLFFVDDADPDDEDAEAIAE